MVNEAKGDSDLIQALIEKEAEAALALLSEEGMRSRMKERLEEEYQRGLRFRSPWLKRAPLTAAALLLISVLAVSLYLFRDREEAPGGPVVFARFLAEAPGVQSLRQWNRLNRLPPSAEMSSEPSFIRQMRETYSILQKPVPAGGPKVPDQSGGESVQGTDTSEMLERMIREQSIHRFLTKYSKHNQEEKNG